MARSDTNNRCDMYKCYSSPVTIKVIIWWDIFRVCLPIFLFVVSLLVAINDDDEDNNDGNIDSSMLTPSPGEGSSDLSNKLTMLSLLLGEILRAMMIVAAGILAYCRKFTYIPMGTYFWTRGINSMINILSHLFMFLILGANIFTLIVTTSVFAFDMYLNFIIWYFWQLPNKVRTSTLSNSEQSQALSIDDVVNGITPPQHELKSIQEAKRRDIQNQSQSKEGEMPVRLKLDSDDESRNEEDKEESDIVKLPSIAHRRATQNVLMTKDENSKTTGMYDDLADGLVRRTSSGMPDKEISAHEEPVSRYHEYNSSKPSDKRIFFTSSHIKMVERSPKNVDRKAMTMKKREANGRDENTYIKKDMSSQLDNKWVKSDDENDISGRPVLDTREKSLMIRNNASNMNIDGKHSDRNTNDIGRKFRNTPSNSNTDIRSRIKKLKITSQIECVDNVTSMQSDDNNFRSNRK